MTVDWAGVPSGTPVKVQGDRGTYVFKYHATHPRSGVETVTVYGGSRDPNADRAFRSFDPARCTPKPTKEA